MNRPHTGPPHEAGQSLRVLITPRHFAGAAVAALLLASAAFATNPLITDQFTADPTARVFEGKIYVYPSHDIKEPPGYKGRPKWFVMEDYHVFSSENLTDWKDHGVILTRTDVEWADPIRVRHVGAGLRLQRRQVLLLFSRDGRRGGRRIPDRRGGRGHALRTVQAPGYSHRRREGNRSRRAHRQGRQRLPVLFRGQDLRREAEAEHGGDRGRTDRSSTICRRRACRKGRSRSNAMASTTSPTRTWRTRSSGSSTRPAHHRWGRSSGRA